MVRKYSAGFVNKNRGTWRAIISYQEDGKQKRVSKSTGIKCYPGKDNRNKARAEEFLRQWREELVQQEAMSQPVHDMMPFYGYCERYLSMHPVKPVTMSGYLTTMRKILNTPLGNRPLAEVTGDDIREWEQDLRDNGLSETTISHNHAFVSMVLKYAFAEGRIARNPVLAVKRPRRAHRSINSITRELRAEILKKMDASSNESLAMSVRLALFTGMRRGEVCALKWCDVDLEEGAIHVVHALTKDHGFRLDVPKDPAGGDTTRVIPIGKRLTGYLRDHRRAQNALLREIGGQWTDEIYVVGDPLTGYFLNPDMLGRQWSMLSDAEGWTGTQGRKVSFHDLRHSFATFAIRDHLLDVMALSKILGHRDPAFTLNVYADALEEAKRTGMDAYDASMG